MNLRGGERWQTLLNTPAPLTVLTALAKRQQLLTEWANKVLRLGD
jgi:hypothetical protein